jgi:hypothetical protein
MAMVMGGGSRDFVAREPDGSADQAEQKWSLYLGQLSEALKQKVCESCRRKANVIQDFPYSYRTLVAPLLAGGVLSDPTVGRSMFRTRKWFCDANHLTLS